MTGAAAGGQPGRKGRRPGGLDIFPKEFQKYSQWILPCQIDRTGPRSITVISMGSVLLPADRSSKPTLECGLDRALC
jgi:hypothetical protein